MSEPINLMTLERELVYYGELDCKRVAALVALVREAVLAAKKQQRFKVSHALCCNYQVPHTETPRCNCGVNDLQTLADKVRDDDAGG